MPQLGNYGPQTLSANGQIIGPIRADAARNWSVQFSTTNFNGAVSFEHSLDGVTWTGAPLIPSTNTSSAFQTTSSFTGTSLNLFLYGPCPGNFVRLRVTSFTSGTVTAIVALSDAVISLHSAGSAGTVSTGFGPGTSQSAVTTVSNGTAVDFGSSKRSITFSNEGTQTGATVRLQVSLDGATYYDTAVVSTGDTTMVQTLDITATGLYTVNMPIAARYARTRITVAPATGSVTTRFAAAG